MRENTQQEAQSSTKVEIADEYCQKDTDPLEELCKTLDLKPEVHTRVLENIPKADYTALLATVNFRGHPPTAGVLAQYGLIWETCQVCGDKQLHLEIDAKLATDLKDVRDHQLALAGGRSYDVAQHRCWDGCGIPTCSRRNCSQNGYCRVDH